MAMSLPTIHAVVDAVASLREQPGQLHNAFNTAALMLNDEMDLSRVIGWMLDPAGTHGQADCYLRMFLDICRITVPENCVLAKVRLEVPRYAAGQLMGRVDIEVSHPAFLVIIENKPKAEFGKQQLQRYTRTLPHDHGMQARVVTLLGAGWDAAAIAAIERTGTRALKLGTDVREWVASCKSATTAMKVAAFLNDLELDLDKRYAGRDARNVQQIIDLLTATPETVAASVAIMNARDILALTLNDRFAGFVQDRARRTGLGELHSVPGEPFLFSASRNGTLRIDIVDQRLDFAISADATYFREVAIGVCVRKFRNGLAKTYAREIAQLRGALGPGQEISADWLWWDHVQSLDVSGKRSINSPDLWAWASDASDTGLAAAFVKRALEAKTVLFDRNGDP